MKWIFKRFLPFTLDVLFVVSLIPMLIFDRLAQFIGKFWEDHRIKNRKSRW